MDGSGSELDLPGFRFHPTEEELLDFYLRRMVQKKKLNFDIIGTINFYRHDPWELPGLAKINGGREWYFFVPRDRRQSIGGRPNRTTERGFWKATGSDRPIRSAADPKRLIGLKKTLVFYMGRAPRGSKTDWVMNEYRLPETSSSVTPPKEEDIVLCKIYRKATSLKELELRAAMEVESRAALGTSTVSLSTMSVSDTVSSSEDAGEDGNELLIVKDVVAVQEEVKLKDQLETTLWPPPPSSKLAVARSANLPELEVGTYGTQEWTQDPLWAQLRSPWMMEQWSPYANLLNF